MRTFFRRRATAALMLVWAAATQAMPVRIPNPRAFQSQKYSWADDRTQPVEFSSDMEIFLSSGMTQTVKLYVGHKRARLDRSEQDDDTRGIGSIILDFQSQLIFVLIPQSNLYLQIEGSLGMPFYRGGWLFRPENPGHPCNAWIREADDRGVSLRCEAVGQETLAGRTVQRWDATTSRNTHGSLWYDPDLNFVTKVQRVSEHGMETGYELKNIKVGPQPASLFEIPNGYRKFTLPKLIDALTGAAQW